MTKEYVTWAHLLSPLAFVAALLTLLYLVFKMRNLSIRILAFERRKRRGVNVDRVRMLIPLQLMTTESLLTPSRSLLTDFAQCNICQYCSLHIICVPFSFHFCSVVAVSFYSLFSNVLLRLCAAIALGIKVFPLKLVPIVSLFVIVITPTFPTSPLSQLVIVYLYQASATLCLEAAFV